MPLRNVRVPGLLVLAVQILAISVAGCRSGRTCPPGEEPRGGLCVSVDDGGSESSPDADGCGEEQCNGLDDDCDGTTDEGLADVPCGDEACGEGTQSCVDGAFTTCSAPGATEEVCGDGMDQDCDGSIDEGCPCSAPRPCYAAGPCMAMQACNDGHYGVCVAPPARGERCNERDDDCDGSIDEGLERPFYEDRDGDGRGDPAREQLACAAPSGFVANDDDCDDDCVTCAPGNPEVCDGADNDCDGSIDEGSFDRFYRDRDGDGFGDPSDFVDACSAPAGFVDNDRDCDPGDPRAYPGATFQPTPRMTVGGFDFNCDGEEEYRYPSVRNDCDPASCTLPWWDTNFPECGESGPLVTCEFLSSCREDTRRTEVQSCR